MRALTALLLLAGCLLAAGCELEEPPETIGTAATEPEPEPEREAGPLDETLADFVEAAGAGDARAMWALLSAPSRERYGPAFADFRAGAAHEFEEGLGTFAAGSYEPILGREMTGELAVAAIAGERTVEGMEEYGAYAAALRREGEGWRIELGGEVTVLPVAPEPGATTGRDVDVSARITAAQEAADGTIWLDGEPLSTHGTVADGDLVLAGTASALDPGRHAVVAFGFRGSDGAAAAWTFTVSD